MLNGVDGTNVSSFQFMVDYHDAVWDWHQGADGVRTWDHSKVVFSDSNGDEANLSRHSSRTTSKAPSVSKASIERVKLYKSAHFDPKISFEVSKSLRNKCFCVVYDHFSGSMLASVSEILKPRRCSDRTEDWTGTLKFYRVYASAEAVNVVKNDSKAPHGDGKNALKLVAAETDVHAALTEFTYHRGDVEYPGDVRDIIGLVRWLPVRYKADPGGLSPDYFKGYEPFDLIYVGFDINERVSKARKR